MATKIRLPPLPWANLDFNSLQWQDWFKELRKLLAVDGFPWDVINFTNSNITDIVNRDHANLQNLQGGTTGEHYHLTSSARGLIEAASNNTYVPSYSGLTQTVTGANPSVAVTGNFTKFGSYVTFSVSLVCTDCNLSNAGGGYVTLPFTCTLSSTAPTLDDTAKTILGTAYIDSAVSQAILPTFANITNIVVNGTYKV